jgi:uncharacterized protein (DUF305 family)
MDSGSVGKFMRSIALGSSPDLRSTAASLLTAPALIAVFALVCIFSLTASAQQGDTKSQPVVVQPGAPGQATQRLPSNTRAQLPPLSAKDVEFMQGMIMHHAQAVEMTALIDGRTTNKNLKLLGSRISHSQADEMKYMERWLKLRGEPTSMPMPPMKHTPGMDMSKHDHHRMLMPGMLTQEQMDALKNSSGAEFDRLFLRGMIQHHKGALVMVDDLFNTAGAGQDSELFNFATEVDNGQRAEIRVMETMLGEMP